MTSRIRARKDVNEEQTTSQRKQNADESYERQKSEQIFTEEFENRKNIF